jgi:acyl carrier protein
MNIQEQLINYLVTEVAADLGKNSLAPEEDLLEQGIIDSMGIMSLISFMEEKFAIIIEEQEIVPEHFQTVSAMASFVIRKKEKVETGA